MKFFTIIACCLLLLSPDADAARKKAEPAQPNVNKEIQAAVMSFADSWSTTVGQSTRYMAAELESKETELQLMRFRYMAQLAAYDIASGPYPGMSLLDMMVLTSLTRAVWDGYWLQRFGDSTSNVRRLLKEMEDGIWATGSIYFTPGQLSALRDLVDEWSIEHPRANSANFVRLGDFGELSRKPALNAATKKGGLLSPIRDVAQSADDIKEMGERAIFLSLRMQELMMGRLELMTQQTLQEEELQQLFADISGFREVAEKYATIIDGLPGEVEGVVGYTVAELSRERQAAIEQMLNGITAERAAAVEQVMVAVALERQHTLEQTLQGLKAQRVGLIKAVGHIFFWLELEMRALVIRLFIIFTCLIVGWYGARLIYRYWVDRVANNFLKVLGVALLLVAISVPLLYVGTYLVLEMEPDLSQKAEFTEEMIKVIEEMHE